MKVDPKSVTNFCRTDRELQAFWLFSIAVAGKNSDIASYALQRFLSNMRDDQTPFEYLSELGEIGIQNALVASRIGQYYRIKTAFVQSLDLDLRTCSLEDLTAIFGVGPKTARFFLLHTRKNIEYAILDTHILAWMRKHGVEYAPTKTPHPKEYEKYERLFIKLAKAHFPGMALADIDLLIWIEQSGRITGTWEGGSIQ